MKLLFVLFASLAFAMPSDIFAEEAGMSIDDALALIGGILDGMNVKQDVEHLKECLALIPSVISAIKALIEEFKTIDWKDLDKIFALFSKLFDTLRALFDTLKPCFKVPTDIEKIIEKLKKIDPTKLLAKIMAKIWVIFTTITDCLKKIEKKLWAEAGKDIGDIIYLLFLEEDSIEMGVMAGNDVENFFKGFFKGLKADEDWKIIQNCVKDIEKHVLAIIAAIKKILTFEIGKVIEGLKTLFAEVTAIIQMIEPCLKGTSRLKKLVEEIMNADILKIAWRIVTHVGEVIKDLTKIINGFNNKDFGAVGEGLGAFLDILFLEDRRL